MKRRSFLARLLGSVCALPLAAKAIIKPSFRVSVYPHGEHDVMVSAAVAGKGVICYRTRRDGFVPPTASEVEYWLETRTFPTSFPCHTGPQEIKPSNRALPGEYWERGFRQRIFFGDRWEYDAEVMDRLVEYRRIKKSRT